MVATYFFSNFAGAVAFNERSLSYTTVSDENELKFRDSFVFDK